jgi:hypothetical protein
MVAYIVGLITGCICMVAALVYFYKMDMADATLGYAVAIVGGVVFLLSAILVALNSLRCSNTKPRAGASGNTPEASDRAADDLMPEDLTLDSSSGSQSV